MDRLKVGTIGKVVKDGVAYNAKVIKVEENLDDAMPYLISIERPCNSNSTLWFYKNCEYAGRIFYPNMETENIPEFNIGDRVKLSDGRSGTIKCLDLYKEVELPYGVIVDNYEIGSLWFGWDKKYCALSTLTMRKFTEEEIEEEKKSMKKKFVVGDIVCGTEGRYFITNEKMTKGEVTAVYSDGDISVKILEHKDPAEVGHTHVVDPNYFLPYTKFKVGDFISGIEGKYSITNHKMTKGEVIKVYANGSIRVRVVEHEEKRWINDENDVSPEFFVPYKAPKPKFKVGDYVKGISDSYAYTDVDMTIGQVKKVSGDMIDIRIIEHKRGELFSDIDFTVSAEDFELTNAPTPKDVKLVYVTFPHSTRRYTFKVPEKATLKKGDKVYVFSTQSMNNVIVECATDSFVVPEDAAKNIEQGIGCGLQTVKGRAVEVTKMEMQEF